MNPHDQLAPVPSLDRMPTHVHGLDRILDGGLFVGDAYLIAGEPGTGKTTLGNHLAFAHAAAGGRVLFATILTESHDRMLAHLGGFAFVDRAYVGEQIHYISLLSALQDGKLEGMLQTLIDTVRRFKPTLLVVDGTGVARSFAGSDFDFAFFIHGLQARTALLGCTTIMLASAQEADGATTHVDGVIRLSNVSTLAQDTRSLRVLKLRGSQYLNGQHAFAIGPSGVTVFPRLESVFTNLVPQPLRTDIRLSFGIPSFDTMVTGGAAQRSSTLVLGPPGAGKTIFGLHFLAAGAQQGEPGLIATFQETPPDLASTADRVGIDLAPHLDSGLVSVLWRSPLEFEPDEWAAQLLAMVDEHQIRRLVIDALSDLFRLFVVPARKTAFAQALAIALRDRGVTTLVLLEIDAITSQQLTLPVPNLSAAMDMAVLLRTIELNSTLRRLVSVLKQRESGFDPVIREFEISSSGITIGNPFGASGLLG